MRLAVIESNPDDPARLIALFAQARGEFLALGIETEPIDLGLAVCLPALAHLNDANCVTAARVPRGHDASKLLADAAAWFKERGGALGKIVPNPATDADAERAPLEAALRTLGWREHRRDVLRLAQAPPSTAPPPGVSVLSARAVPGPYESFCRAVAEHEPQLADLALLRLDDPRFDALVALHAGQVVARAGVLSLGETGLIENVVTRPEHRRRGYARAVMGRAIDVCARSQFKRVLLGCDTDNTAGQALYAALGFTRIGQHVEWHAGDTRAAESRQPE
jgi:ribosomal protein S18 acetylase RimI-like enzyme